jgi:hypothetical protein
MEQKSKKGRCKICGVEHTYRKKSKADLCDNPQCRIKMNNTKKSEELEKSRVLNEDYVQCQWCKLNVSRIYGSHMKLYHPRKTTEDYRREFPEARLASKKDNANVAQGYVRFSQSEKGKKLLSERASGENNPNSQTKTTKEQRKERSPFSTEKYLKQGMTLEEAESKVAEFAKVALKDRVSPLTLEYWLARTEGDEEKARKLLSERQRTFTLDKCIEKFGEEEGRKKWIARQEKWIKNYRKKSYSFISQELFWRIQEEIKFENDEIAFATFNNGKKTSNVSENHEAKLFLDNRLVLPDFIHFPSNKIIEFDGVYYHRNSPENKQRERQRDQDLQRNGYHVFHVNEKEYRDSPEESLQKCIIFLNEKTFA